MLPSSITYPSKLCRPLTTTNLLCVQVGMNYKFFNLWDLLYCGPLEHELVIYHLKRIRVAIPSFYTYPLFCEDFIELNLHIYIFDPHFTHVSFFQVYQVSHFEIVHI